MTEPILFEVKNLSTSPRRTHKFHLQNISFRLPEGYIMGLIGKNCAGKTTFFRTVMKENAKYTGKLILGGKDLAENHREALEQIGFISEDNLFLGCRSLSQNAELLGRFYSGFQMEHFEEAIGAFHLPQSKNIHDLSRGEAMKFQLAFAMAHHPKLYLLDEATAGMDPVFRMDLYKILRQLMEKDACSVILSTHSREEITKELDYVGVLEQGRLTSFGENEWC